MTLLLHISDMHLGTEVPAVVAALQALARARRPQVLVASGDLTQRAKPAEFDAALRLCDSLDVPQRLVLPGNHDIPLFDLAARLAHPYRDYSRCFGDLLEPELDLPGLLVVGVNTTRASRHKNGVVSPSQVARVAQRLRQAGAGQLRLVVTHQPADVIREEDDADRLRGAEPALQAWSGAGADLVLGGHIHLPYVKDLRERAQPTARRMWCVQAGTAVSDRLRHDTCNSVNFIEALPPRDGERSCRFERWDYSGARGAFEQVEARELALSPV